MTRFIALRDRSGNWHRPAPATLRGAAPRDAEAGADPEIDVLDVPISQLRDVINASDLLALAPAVATRLIGSEPLDELRDGDTVAGWGLEAVGAKRSDLTGAGGRVALLGTGIDAHHPAFHGVQIEAHDSTGSGIEDANGHGTHLAGTVLGRDVEGLRIGVARGLDRLLVAKAMPDDGHGSSESFLRAFLWAMRQGPDIIGFSLCFDTAFEIERLTEDGFPLTLATAAAQTAYRGNLRIFEMLLAMKVAATAPLVMGAVGDDSRRMVSPLFETGPAAPAAARGVLSVGALIHDGDMLRPPVFSNAGPALSAPGAGIVSARAGGGVRTLHGTAMALGHAVGIAALWAEDLRRSGRQVHAEALAAALLGHATLQGIDPALFSLNVGAGMVQAP